MMTAEDVLTFPASFGQQRLWLLHQWAPDSPVYSMPAAFDAEGPLDLATLRASFLDVVRRHEALRTVFTLEKGELCQTIRSEPDCPFEVVDLAEEPELQREALAEEITRMFVQHPFDLARGPLLRVTVLRFGAKSHRLLFNAHHIIFDGWSQDVLLRELAEFYRARISGDTPALAPLPIQYADFAAWQREQLQGDALGKELAFWKEQLRDLPPVLDLPTDHPRPAQPTSAGADLFLDLPGELGPRLHEFCRREGTTIFATLAAAFQILLHRHTGQEEMLVGIPLANRNRAETEGLIGFFVNTVVLRGDLRGRPSVREVLARARAATLGAVAHADLPFEKLIEELQPDRQNRRNPLFETMFTLQTRSAADTAFPGLELRLRNLDLGAAKFDLLFEIIEDGDTLAAHVNFSTELFEFATMRRMAGHFAALLRAMIEAPEQCAATLPMLAPGEREQLLAWSRNEREWPRERTVAQLFAERAAQAPEKIAVLDGETRWTYRELAARAAAVAQFLGAQGIGRSDLVGVPAERSAQFLAAIVGVLQAGAAYVPLSLEEPPERLEQMRRGCRLVLDLKMLPAPSDAPLPAPAGAPSDPAYVLFTSGSTGGPKGVVVPHSGIVRLVVNSDYVTFREDEVVALASNLCFDAATFEIWGALLNGGTLVPTPPEVLLDPARLTAHLATHGVTTLFLTTSLFNQLAQQAPTMFRGLRNLVFGGEAADADCAARVLAAGKPQRLVNGYGPTEVTTFAVCHVIESVEGARVPIGRPIANTTALILDRDRQLVPIGLAGEIYLGGPGVALGYHDAPELTAERFVETEWGRLYRTGDLACWREDGTIDFLGRADEQIKLRGFRIEPGEIEAALRQVPGLGHSVVLARETAAGDRQLVAYFTPNGTTPPEAAIRAQLQRRLPAWMLPSAFVPLARLPLTPNGKLDVRALPAPDFSHQQPATQAPETTLHIQLVELWEELLGRHPIGMHDDFFELGGHSLLAAKMLASVEARIGLPVPFWVLFESATIANLADFLVSERRRESAERPIVTIQPRGEKTPLLFLHGDFSGGGFYCRNLARHIGADRPFYAIHPHGLHGELPPSTVEAMAADRLRSVREIQPHGPYLIGGFCNGAIVAFEMARQLEAAGEKVGAVVMLGADGSGYRYRHLARFTHFLSLLCEDDEDGRAARFLRWRARMQHVKKWWDSQRLRFLAATSDARHIPRRAAELFRHWTNPDTATPVHTPNPSTSTTPPVERAYMDALRAYVPRRLHTRAILIWPADDPSPSGLHPAYGWESICPEVRVVTVPGEHHSSIALDENLSELAEHVRLALDEADQRTP